MKSNVITARHSEKIRIDGTLKVATASSVSVSGGDDLQAEDKYSLASILEDIQGIGVFAASASGGGTDNVAVRT